MNSLATIQKDIRRLANPERAGLLGRFFKTGKGQYGEGDIFHGITVPQQRKIAGKYRDLPLRDITGLLQSKFHEERLIALIILVTQYERGEAKERKSIYDFYLSHTKYINNWDLVDTSAHKIVGAYLVANSEGQMAYGSLEKLARSENMWERRIAVIATFAFINNGDEKLSLQIADILLHDNQDLIQKAVGWMLREVGKRVSQETEEDYLKTRYKTMPRTMLRYAIERFPEERRKQYLSGMIQ